MSARCAAAALIVLALVPFLAVAAGPTSSYVGEPLGFLTLSIGFALVLLGVRGRHNDTCEVIDISDRFRENTVPDDGEDRIAA